MSDYVPGPGDPPVEFGRYRLLGKLGEGGMGTVYLAEDTRLRRQVALKVPKLRPQYLALFQQEVQAAARLNHSNLCVVHDAEQIGATWFLTMHYIEGKSLKERLAEYLDRPRKAVTLAEKLARAMAHAHEKGVIHRDLKPSNIILDARDEPVIVDFGLAVQVGTEPAPSSEPGGVVGSYPYMAPEQHSDQADKIGPRGDVYSLGVVLYELLRGDRPFHGNAYQLLYQKQREEYDPLADPKLDALCRPVLKYASAERCESMDVFAAALAKYQ